jgi:hypothetical protein
MLFAWCHEGHKNQSISKANPSLKYLATRDCQCKQLRKNLDIAGFVAFRTNAALERNALVFGQTLKACRLYVLKMGEQICATSIWCDKAEALSVVEPFDYACLSGHVISLKILNIGKLALEGT